MNLLREKMRLLPFSGALANVDATDLAAGNSYMNPTGQAIVATGSAAPGTGLVATDVIRPCIIRAGTEVAAILLSNTDLDTGSPAIVFGMGYAPVNSTDGPTADAAYFAAAGQTTLQALNEGRVFNNFAPKKFEYDVYLTLTIGTTATTPAAGTVRAVVLGTATGTK